MVGPENWHFSYLAAQAGHTPMQTGLGMGTVQAIGARTGAGGLAGLSL